MLHHILGFKRDAFTITGRDQLGTINERLYIIFPGTRHYKPCQLANGRESWHECEERQRRQKRKVESYRIRYVFKYANSTWLDATTISLTDKH